jgi:hypothetical protein
MTTAVHKNIVVLARMLERLERSTVRLDAQQYRTLVRHLADELSTVANDARLQSVLEGFPAAAELYENLHYRHSGLCRSPLQQAMAAELDARKLIHRVRTRAADQPKR